MSFLHFEFLRQVESSYIYYGKIVSFHPNPKFRVIQHLFTDLLYTLFHYLLFPIKSFQTSTVEKNRG